MPLTLKWSTKDTVLTCVVGEPDEKKSVAAFDLDSTLASRSGHELLHGVHSRLHEIIKTHRIVIFSNQPDTYIGDQKLKEKFTVVAGLIDLPLVAMFARKYDNCRKPGVGMITLLGHKPDYFVGDAAGRPADHSDCDKEFAKTADLKFYIPEEFFDQPRREIENFKFPDHQCMIVLCGYPASGKSTWAAHQVNHPFCTTIISRDALGTMEACYVKSIAELKAGNNVIIDNLNPDVASRKKFVEIAAKAGKPCYAITVDLDMQTAMLNNSLRDKKIPKIVFYKFRKTFKSPHVDEGFKAVHVIGGYKSGENGVKK